MSPPVEEIVVADPILTVYGPDGTQREQFVGLVTLIGASPDADLCLPSEDVDDLHCLLTMTTAGLVAKECFTRTGLFVNGERVTETLLSDDDELNIGPFRLRLQLPTGGSHSEGELHQDLIQQMAKRIAGLETKRQAALRRAWQWRVKANTKKQRPPSRPGSFGGVDLSKLNAVESELAAERRRTAALEAEMLKTKATKRPDSKVDSVILRDLKAEIERLKGQLTEKKFRAEDQDAVDSLKEYEQQLNDFRDQLSRDAEDLQNRESDLAQRSEEIRIAEEQLQAKIADTEKELAGERARVKREQSQIERMTAECRQDLEEMQREAENLERDEKFQRLRSQIRGNRDEKEAMPITLSEKIQRFLKGMGG